MMATPEKARKRPKNARKRPKMHENFENVGFFFEWGSRGGNFAGGRAPRPRRGREAAVVSAAVAAAAAAAAAAVIKFITSDFGPYYFCLPLG